MFSVVPIYTLLTQNLLSVILKVELKVWEIHILFLADGLVKLKHKKLQQADS